MTDGWRRLAHQRWQHMCDDNNDNNDRGHRIPAQPTSHAAHHAYILLQHICLPAIPLAKCCAESLQQQRGSAIVASKLVKIGFAILYAFFSADRKGSNSNSCMMLFFSRRIYPPKLTKKQSLGAHRLKYWIACSQHSEHKDMEGQAALPGIAVLAPSAHPSHRH